ncbi:MAG: nucleotide sugar dehydrogenase [archaeon]|nr:nucleotide sugar dehydrogenase [archaeon]
MKIAIAGTGYVGLSMACLLSQHNEVTAVDICQERVDKINKKESFLDDKEIIEYLSTKPLKLKATTDGESAYKDAEFIIISTPTNYDVEKDFFDTSSIYKVMEVVKKSGSKATVVVKSTVNIGFTEKLIKDTGYPDIIFSPEFLREGHALYDNLYPSRIVTTYPKGNEKLKERAITFANLLKEGAIKKEIQILHPNCTEGEAIKLFANSYLAMRVSFFNELDSFAEVNGLNTQQIIEGVSYDPRIGLGYNNPSFGYGGYCLPKDTKQLLANFKGIPQNMMTAIVGSNKTRKEFIASQIIKKLTETKKIEECNIGIYRLVMKAGSDNFRESAIQDILNSLKEKGAKIIVYEPMCKGDEFNGLKVIKDLAEFKNTVDIILANRLCDELKDCKDKVYTRDIYSRDS